MGVCNVTGRPLKFNSPEELEKKINEYFEYCDNNKKPYTVNGLCAYLDCTADALLDYENMNHSEKLMEKEKQKSISDTIKGAKQKILTYAEEYLFTGRNQVGCIFNLKNNWGWVDKQEIVQTNKSAELSEEDLEKVKEKYGLK